jgi:hypothetical protein
MQVWTELGQRDAIRAIPWDVQPIQYHCKFPPHLLQTLPASAVSLTLDRDSTPHVSSPP